MPAIVLAQAWRGRRQERVARLLRGCRVTDFREQDARAAGEALGASGTSDVADASVVVTAIARAEAIATSDPADVTAVASALGRRPRLHVV